MPDIYTAAVVGLGQIGMGYDYAEIETGRVLTHASAFQQHPGFKLIAGVSPDPDHRRRFQSRYALPAYTSVDDLYRGLQPDVVGLAVPTDLHLEVMTRILAHNPRAIICEKPLEESWARVEQIAEICRKSDCSVLVNYFRRFEPGVLEIKRNLEDGSWGNPLSGNVWYSRGLNNNASHLIDLACFLFGDISDIRVIRAGRSVLKNDIEPDFLLKAGGVELCFRAWPSENYALNAFELLLDRGRLRYDNSGHKISFASAQDNPLFPGKLSLGESESAIRNDLERYQWHVVNALFKHLANNEPLSSNIDTALETSRVVDRIFSAGATNERR